MNLDTDEIKEYGINVNHSTEYLGDCLDIMPKIPDESIDMILCDLPYGQLKSDHKWDCLLPLDLLWGQYKRIIKPYGAIVLTANNPFSAKLILSNEDMFKYSLVWDKKKPGNVFVGKLRPLSYHEDILVFSKGNVASGSKNNMNYYPQMISQKERVSKVYGKEKAFARDSHVGYESKRDKKYPKSIIEISNANNKGKLHPTQKPTSLFEYLIKTYTKEGEIVLDNTAGVFTTAIACLETNRKYIVIEKDRDYFNKGVNRVFNWKREQKSKLF